MTEVARIYRNLKRPSRVPRKLKLRGGWCFLEEQRKTRLEEDSVARFVKQGRLMMRMIVVLSIVAALLVPAFSQSDVEKAVLQRVQEMMKESGGRVTFSDLHNDSRFSSEQKAFLSRLYEIFFQIPAFLKSEFESTGKVPTRTQIGAGFGISGTSAELLLRVMELDSRVPPLFSRDAATREINSLKLDNIKAFILSRGTQVKITQWEGQQIPAFELEKLGGGVLSSQGIGGKGALLYFWFTGCPPCVRIAPILAKLDEEYRSRGFRIVGLNADRVLEIETSEEQYKAYFAKNGAEYPNLHVDEATRAAFGNINVFPTLFFLNEDLTVVKHLLNYQDYETLEGIILDILN